MPRTQELQDFANQRIQAAVQRRDRRMETVVLPQDFTGMVFLKCKDEAAKIQTRINFLKGELVHVIERIKALETEARSMMPKIVTTRLEGSLLTEFRVSRITNPNQRIRTQKIIDFQTSKIAPLRREQNRYEQEIFYRGQELGQLRRIARACGAGDVGLLCMLSNVWRNRLEIGAGVVGKLPEPVRLLGVRNSVFVDQAGNILPAEALDQAGKPDLPEGQDMPGRGRGWRGDHPEALPGQPADRNATFEKPVQAR